MCGHKLAAEQIRVLVQARPLPGAVHRPCVRRCWTAGIEIAGTRGLFALQAYTRCADVKILNCTVCYTETTTSRYAFELAF